jgi:type I restriction enzyme M protein
MTFSLKSDGTSSNQSGEGEIRKNIIAADLVDCMVGLPGQLFYSTQIPACLWFLARDRRGGSPTRPMRDRRGQIPFIDARKMGRMVDRTHRELTDDDTARIANTYHAWRGVGAQFIAPKNAPADSGRDESRPYQDIPGFCKSATLEDIRKHGYVLTPGRYVAAPEQEKEDDEEQIESEQRWPVAEAGLGPEQIGLQVVHDPPFQLQGHSRRHRPDRAQVVVGLGTR